MFVPELLDRTLPAGAHGMHGRVPAEIGQVEPEGKTGVKQVLSFPYLIGLLSINMVTISYLLGHFFSLICCSKSSLKNLRALSRGSMAPGAKAQNVWAGPNSRVCS
jgi:hypothetical protein